MQTSDLQERFARSGKHAKQIAFLGACFSHDFRPLGSTGRLELAIVDENASAMLGVQVGAPVRVSW